MMSWDTNTDCCNWRGVFCSYPTGDVIYLGLSCGMLQGTLHPNTSLFNHLPYLIELDLSYNGLNGTLPSWLFTSPSLQYLPLSYNMFSGNIPFESFALPSLIDLDLSHNQLSGHIDMQTFRKLTNLTSLDLSFNNFSDELELDTLLSTLTNLESLHLSYSGFSVTTNNTNHYVNPGFIVLCLASCKLKVFPNSFRAMKQLKELDLSSNEIHGQIPHWAGEIGGTQLVSLNLSHNFITGLPQFQWYGLSNLYLQSNFIHGPFPTSICNISYLYILDMSNNRFGGLIPQCFAKLTSSLWIIDMGNNSFQGTIPSLYDKCESLEGLILKGNQLEGEVPISVSNCRSLKVVDLGNNRLNGTFPGWLGDLPNLQALVLKLNNFHGHIQPLNTPFQVFEFLTYLIIEYLNIGGEYYSFVVAVKGVNQHFPKISVDYTIIDLSNNSFEGQIPNVIGGLNSLIVLNLSHNSLTGPIPHALGNLIEIESLDLSWNQLTGEIPESLAGIKRLEVLSLSHNRLVGLIPDGTQFNTFDENSFEGNVGLCGFPLPKRCSEYTQKPQLEARKDDVEESGFTWEVVTLGYGCGTLLGLVMGYLMLSTRKVKWFNAFADATQSLVQEVSNPSIQFMLYEILVKKLKQRRALSNSNKGVTALEAMVTYPLLVVKSRLQARQAIGLDKKHQYEEMTTPNGTTTVNPSPKKTNLLDHHSIKHLLDEYVSEVVASRGYSEDVTTSNIRLLIGAVIIIIALFAQFYNKKFPENKNYLVACIGLYVVFNGILQLIVYTKEKNAILFTYPPAGSAYNSTGLMISSKMPRFSDKYTLTIASADPKSISAKPTVEFTRSVTKWFTKDGVLVEGLFWKDVEGLVNDYNKESKKSKSAHRCALTYEENCPELTGPTNRKENHQLSCKF
uniref:Signal peptidase complex subunit 2 n=1 Tax=Tanacetum cinerariifolium TaxID=118510 RepID=A0A6L2JQB4_TANCI|nr:leucine-rich repeat-containing protein [Tanacetum cinerariifolium]